MEKARRIETGKIAEADTFGGGGEVNTKEGSTEGMQIDEFEGDGKGGGCKPVVEM